MEELAQEVLEGGNVGRVVRVGNSVHRTAGPWTPAVHELLYYLADSGFPFSPRVLGFDSEGCEVLTYIDGETVGASHPWPEWAWADETLMQAGRLLRLYHDTVRNFRPEGERVWRFLTDNIDPGELVCHNDVAPYNVVWREGAIVGIIDWDVAAPGEPITDLAFTAWSFCPIHPPTHAARLGAPTDVVRRLRLLCDSYGLEDRDGVIDAIRRRIQASIDGIKAKAELGEEAFQKLIAAGHLARMEGDAHWLDVHGDRWQYELITP